MSQEGFGRPTVHSGPWQGNQGGVYIPPQEDIAFDLALPEPSFSTDMVTLRLLPDREVQREAAAQFLSNLKGVKKPLAFEILSENDSIYFQLGVAREDRELVETQIRICFPQFAASEETDSPAASLEWRVIEVYPDYPDLPYKTLRELKVDPYVQLFGAMEKLGPEDVLCFQVLFFPLPESVLKTVLGYFSDSKFSRDQATRIREKLPAWQVAMRVFSTEAGAVARVRTNFLGQYETADHKWWVSEVSAKQGFHRSMKQWNILNTAELTAMAHFPGKAVKCEALEMVSGKSKLPPPSYTEEGFERGRD